MLEKIIVSTYFYPIIDLDQCRHVFSDQFAFRPTGSTAAALIQILHQVSELLLTHPYVHIISLDFSKAFDTVRHSTFMETLKEFPLPDKIHNWVVNYLDGRSHCTKFAGTLSTLLEINASFFQGSGFGPVAFIFNNSKLRPGSSGNSLDKFADDTYLIVPPTNSHTIKAELGHIASWSKSQNLNLNASKTREMIVYRQGSKPDEFPAEIQGVQRVKEMKILGVILSENLSFKSHLDAKLKETAQGLYALKVLKSHGLKNENLWGYNKSNSRQ